jgi:hypothetical protein
MLLPAKKPVWSTSAILPICPWRRKVRALHRAFTEQFWRERAGPGNAGAFGKEDDVGAVDAFQVDGAGEELIKQP